MEKFEVLGISKSILKAVSDLGFETPMPIQEKVIPRLLAEQQDLIGLAQTGTGKTAAFGIPLIQLADPSDRRTQSFILAPTRELCMQIAGDLKDYAKYEMGLSIVAIYGGANMERQIRALKKGAQIIVGTPGRVNDLLNRQNKIDLSACRIVVLDEADEMLNMGFKEEIDAILDETPESKNTLLFSATMPDEVLRISKNYMNSPTRITVGIKDAGAENISHFCYHVRSKDRYLALRRIVDYYPAVYGIVFCRTRQETKEVAEKLIQDGYNADALHGDLSQNQREYIMHKFRVKNLQLLVATDVAARGLDVKDITHIINYNLPDEVDLYTHRSGRTGRAGEKGISIIIVNLREKHKIKRIESRLKKKFETRKVPGGREICEKQMLALVDKMQNIEVNHKEIDPFLPKVNEKLEWLTREELIKHFVSLEFNRFLDYYKDAKDLNNPEEYDRRGEKRRGYSSGSYSDKRSSRRDGRDGERGFTRFHINLGFRDSVKPRDLIGLINRCTRRRNIDIGRIDVMKNFSFFDIDSRYASLISEGFKGVEFNRKDVIVDISKEPGGRTFEGKKRTRSKFKRKGGS